MSSQLTAIETLPDDYLIRPAQLVGTLPVTAEQAERNRTIRKETGRNCGPVRAHPGAPGMLPMSAATLYRLIGQGKFPKPVKLGERVSAFKVGDVRAWLQARKEGGAA